MAIAGIFKNAIAHEVGNSFTSVYTAPTTPTAQTSYLIECDIACTGDSGVQITVKLTKADESFAYIVKNAPVPVGSAIQVIDGQKIVLMPGDSLDVKCETPGSKVDVILSLVEDVNI